jgi:hypothetical protein
VENYSESELIEKYTIAAFTLRRLNQALEGRIADLKALLDDCNNKIQAAHPNPDP